MTTLPSLTHMALHVADIAACATFYQSYCGMKPVHERRDGQCRVIWLAEPGRERDFVFVLVSNGARREQAANDYSHYGFACDSKQAVDRMAERGRAEGILVWPPRDAAYPVGYYCGLSDPDGKMVEFSYGQPLGPGAEPISTGG